MSQDYCPSLLQNATLHFLCLSKILELNYFCLMEITCTSPFSITHFGWAIFLLFYPSTTSQLLVVLVHYWLNLNNSCPLLFSLNCHFCHDESLHPFSLPQIKELFIINEQILSITFPTLGEQHFFPRDILPIVCFINLPCWNLQSLPK